jgi:hypothetical protein
MTEARNPQARALTAPRTGKAALIEAAKSQPFDPDIWHILEREDDALIADEVINGALSGVFVYNFAIKGEPVQGISVVGAAHLARKYGGIKHRLIGSIEKRGGLFKFVSYPAEHVPMQVSATYVREFEDDPDYYTALAEVIDVKTGNAVQTERTELRWEKRRDGSGYERPNYQTIAQSKAYRNAVLRLVPQDVQVAFKAECLKLGRSKDITRSVIDEARHNVIAFAAKHALPLARDVVFALGMAEIDGLREAARTGVPAFREAIDALGLTTTPTSHERSTVLVAPTQPVDQVGGEAPANPAPAGPAADHPTPERRQLFGAEA